MSGISLKNIIRLKLRIYILSFAISYLKFVLVLTFLSLLILFTSPWTVLINEVRWEPLLHQRGHVDSVRGNCFLWSGILWHGGQYYSGWFRGLLSHHYGHKSLHLLLVSNLYHTPNRESCEEFKLCLSQGKQW